MRQINLIPPEIAARRRSRQITALVGAIGLGLVAIVVIVYLIQAARLAGEKNTLAGVKRDNTTLERKVAALSQFAQLQATLQTKEKLLTTLTQNEVRWSVLLSDVSLVIPSDVWLTTFSGSVQEATQQTPATAGAAQPIVIGNIQMSGVAFTHLDVAKWLIRLADVREFVLPYLSLSSKSEIGTQSVVQFNSSVNLSDSSLRRNQPGGERQP